jgi:hypothetical protein
MQVKVELDKNRALLKSIKQKPKTEVYLAPSSDYEFYRTENWSSGGYIILENKKKNETLPLNLTFYSPFDIISWDNDLGNGMDVVSKLSTLFFKEPYNLVIQGFK